MQIFNAIHVSRFASMVIRLQRILATSSSFLYDCLKHKYFLITKIHYIVNSNIEMLWDKKYIKK